MKKKILIFALILVAVCAVFIFVYLGDYYHADEEAAAAFAPDALVSQIQLSDRATAFVPEETLAGFIFYPGGKVEHRAYVPLMQTCAQEGILCVLVEMPFNLAVLDMSAAEGIQENFPEVDSWYIGGHSLGGSMAASYLADNAAAFDGLVLLGSYSTADLSMSELSALSIYGSEDGVLNREKYEDNLVNLPDNFTELVIEGGNHAGFGMYGEQEGDGKASVENIEQIYLTAAAIADFIKGI